LRWPYALLPATTHDTKRSEDVRARINVLSELPSEWRPYVARWSRLNQRHKSELDGEPAPSRNDEYLLYQTLIGTWPFNDQSAAHSSHGHDATGIVPATLAATPDYVQRIQQYMLKAVREAKVETSWINPNVPYDQALQSFIAAILADTRNNGFLSSFTPFARRVADYGIWNSLSQTLLRFTSPGVPDIYQGTELWDLSLVDPDNRRPVDYALRRERLESLQARITAAGNELVQLAGDLVSSRTDGRIKLFLITQLLSFRRAHPGLFTTSTYVALEAEGARKEHLCAFIRKNGRQAVVVVAPRLFVRLIGQAVNRPSGRRSGATLGCHCRMTWPLPQCAAFSRDK
jgi:(1->4)-alpha-D-glucan 1-alpha-D-glucosylmutase